MESISNYSNLIIKGTRERLAEFKREVAGFESVVEERVSPTLFSFEKIIPVNKKLKNKNSWLELEKLHKEAWGTASNARAITLEEKYNELAYSFLTKDGMPMPVIKELVKRFPDLKFEYLVRNLTLAEEVYAVTHKGALCIHKSKIDRKKFGTIIYK